MLLLKLALARLLILFHAVYLHGTHHFAHYAFSVWVLGFMSCHVTDNRSVIVCRGLFDRQDEIPRTVLPSKSFLAFQLIPGLRYLASVILLCISFPGVSEQ